MPCCMVMKLMMGWLKPIHPRASRRGLGAAVFASTFKFPAAMLVAMVEVQVFCKMEDKNQDNPFCLKQQRSEKLVVRTQQLTQSRMPPDVRFHHQSSSFLAFGSKNNNQPFACKDIWMAQRSAFV